MRRSLPPGADTMSLRGHKSSPGAFLLNPYRPGLFLKTKNEFIEGRIYPFFEDSREKK
jgi:hypothetical protein